MLDDMQQRYLSFEGTEYQSSRGLPSVYDIHPDHLVSDEYAIEYKDQDILKLAFTEDSENIALRVGNELHLISKTGKPITKFDTTEKCVESTVLELDPKYLISPPYF